MRRLSIGLALGAFVAMLPLSEAIPHLKSTPAPALAGTPTPFQVGVASWYGEEFDGLPTASGEVFDMEGLTAAHRSLPLGTRVKVTNLRNKRSLILRVNDRGPYIQGRMIDVSKAAAYRLGFMTTGLTLVGVKVISYPKGFTRGGSQYPLALETE